MGCHVQVRELALSYRWNDFERLVFQNLNLCIPFGSFVSVSGSNGSGKSSLAKLCLGLISANWGDVLIEGVAVRPGYPEAVRNNHVVYLAQQIEELFYGDTVRQELTYDQNLNLHDQLQVLQDLELEHLLDRNVDSLSGGERQAVALAQFMASHASLLILDEPSSYLDQHRAALLKRYLSKAQQAGKTIIHITQYDAEIAWGSHSIDLDAEAPKIQTL